MTTPIKSGISLKPQIASLMTRLMPNDAVQRISPIIAKKLSPLHRSPKGEGSQTNSKTTSTKRKLSARRKGNCYYVSAGVISRKLGSSQYIIILNPELTISLLWRSFYKLKWLTIGQKLS